MTSIVDRQEVSALRKADVVFVENQPMERYVSGLGQRHVVQAIPGVDTARFAPRSAWTPKGYLLSVCRLGDPRKNLRQVIEAYALVRRQLPDAPDLVLAGRGQLSDVDENVVKLLGLQGHVHVLSDVSPRNLPSLYREASLYVQLSLEEGLGISVMEAMASGLPVVSTDTAGSCVTVLDRKTGFLVPLSRNEDVPARAAEAMFRVLTAEGPGLSLEARMRAADDFSTGVCLRRFTYEYDRLLQ